MTPANGVNTPAYWQTLDRKHRLHPFNETGALSASGGRLITRADGAYLMGSEGYQLLDNMAGL